MFCMNCGKEVPEGAKFCNNCGAALSVVPKSEAPAANEAAPPAPEPKTAPAPEPASQPSPTPQAVPQVKEEKKKFKLSLPVIICICAAVVIAAIILAAILLGNKEINNSDASPVTTTAVKGYNAFSSKELDISFLYPDSAQIRDNGTKGVYVYTGGNQGVPYIQVETEGKVSTDSYFKKYKNSLSNQYDDAEVGDINEVKIVDKTLYMVRAKVFTDGADQVVDRYIEQYKNKTVVYTVKSYSEGSEEMALKAIVESLRPDAGAYAALAGSSTGTWGQDTSASVETSENTGDDSGSVSAPTTTIDTGSETGTDTTESTTDDDGQVSGSGTAGGYGSGDYDYFYSSDYSWAFMADTSLIDNSANEGTGIRLYPKGKTDQTASIFIQKNNFTSQGVSTAQEFIDSYTEQLKQNGAAQTQDGAFQGTNFSFAGVLGADQNGTYGITVWACNDSNGNIYSIYYECSDADWAMYTEIAQGIMYSFTINE